MRDHSTPHDKRSKVFTLKFWEGVIRVMIMLTGLLDSALDFVSNPFVKWVLLGFSIFFFASITFALRHEIAHAFAWPKRVFKRSLSRAIDNRVKTLMRPELEYLRQELEYLRQEKDALTTQINRLERGLDKVSQHIRPLLPGASLPPITGEANVTFPTFTSTATATTGKIFFVKNDEDRIHEDQKKFENVIKSLGEKTGFW